MVNDPRQIILLEQDEEYTIPEDTFAFWKSTGQLIQATKVKASEKSELVLIPMCKGG